MEKERKFSDFVRKKGIPFLKGKVASLNYSLYLLKLNVTSVGYRWWISFSRVCICSTGLGLWCIPTSSPCISQRLQMLIFHRNFASKVGSQAKDYSLIAFDERVTFWLQRIRSLPCACANVALFARRLVNHYAIAHAYNAANAHAQGSDWACWSQKVTLWSKAIWV